MESCIQSIICLKTSLADEKYNSYELEVLALVEALKISYLFIVIILKLSPIAQHSRKPWEKGPCYRVARWVLLLEEFDYEITHRPGDRMKHA
ncbi:hypothetical protein CEXT_237401 [Caerostris extrusa]|uniref:Reverse transcriptase RNase H-like domain-containing protein n=1 Tax=Caerostris extrusa TaxID=172846 RepID=A0AAV4WJ41_CAEEX|nr:hypothetical protein CEXT_237401 [Caerostris extrusa]